MTPAYPAARYRIFCAFAVSRGKPRRSWRKAFMFTRAAALETNGWITRTPCAQDRRALRVYPTPKAEAVIPQLHQMLTEWSDYLTASLSPQEADTLLALLNRVADRAEAWATERGQD